MIIISEEKLKEIIKQAVIEALTIPITWKQAKDTKTGQPLATPEYKQETVFIPSFIVQHIKFQEGAFRGLQTDVSKKNNQINKLEEKVDVIGKTLLSMGDSARRLAYFSDAIKALPEVKIEGDP